jgi:SAM-dependent methyltransferase
MSVGSITADTALPYAAASFNKVLSVDAAYHFKTREKFVAEASRTLVVGGRLVVADMILCVPFHSLSFRQRCCLRVVAAAAGIPLANMVDESEYVELLHRHGFGTPSLPSRSQ